MRRWVPRARLPRQVALSEGALSEQAQMRCADEPVSIISSPQSSPPASVKAVYTDPRFWRLAPLLGRKDRRKNFACAPALRRADIEMGGGANGARRKGENQDALLLGAPHHGLRVWQVAG